MPESAILPAPEQLLDEYRLYDQYVDVVSAFEWIFTDIQAMPETVTHFERFPRLDGQDNNPATPDFTVVFKDGAGLVAEIARIALPDESVESLCSQLARYDALTQLPGPGGRPIDVNFVDVLLLVPLELGTDVVRRVIKERMLDKHHTYAPSTAPCVVQFVAQPDRYVFQRRPDVENGVLRDGDRDPALGGWLQQSDFKPKASGFAHRKAARPFMNDPIAPLYLACQLWTKVFATRAGDVAAVGDYKPLVMTTTEIADDLRQQYGRGSKRDVRRAMEILLATRCAQQVEPDLWRVAWGDLAHQAGEDLSEVLARRTAKPPAKGTIKRLIETYEDLGITDPLAKPDDAAAQLFDDSDY